MSELDGRDLDPDEVDRLAFLLWSYKQGEVVSLLVHLGDRLGLYALLDGAGALSAEEVAARSGLHPRWLLEWLRSMAAAGLLRSADGERFELRAEAAEVLLEERGSLRYAGGAFTGPPDPSLIEDLETAFRTGVGYPYDRQGPSGVHRTERMLGPWARLALVGQVLPLCEGVPAALEAGILVADVGCGAGVALCAMAEAFPRSTFHGYELSELAVERARAKAAEMGLANIEIFHRRAEEIPRKAAYGLVLTFDCLHDMTHPEDGARAIRGAIRDDGTWLVKEVRCADSWDANTKNPMLAMFLGFSLTSCLASSMSEPGGAGLGTIGLPPSAVAKLGQDAGFRSCSQLAVDDPANLYYALRP